MEKEINVCLKPCVKMRFKTFVPGVENQIAVNLLKVLSADTAAHPLTVLVGHPGCGKTHLANALALRIQKRTKLKVGLTNGRRFVDSVVSAYQHKKFEALSKELLALDVLIFDDFDTLSGKGRSQEVLLDFMREAEHIGKSLVFTVSRSSLPCFDWQNDSLRARIADATPIALRHPGQSTLETMMRRGAEKRGVILGDAELGLLFGRCRITSQRGVEGLLTVLNAYSRWLGTPIDAQLIDALSAVWAKCDAA